MVRQIIKIDEDLCNGCGLCVSTCHESAIALVDNKAKLIRDDYCDGLGNCLPVCPTGAISFETREALEYNEEEVKRNMENKKKETAGHVEGFSGCPGSRMMSLRSKDENENTVTRSDKDEEGGRKPVQSMLRQWPV